MKNTLLTLAEIHYDLGLIGHNEYCERTDIALWVSSHYDMKDPRELPSDYTPPSQESTTLQGKSRLVINPPSIYDRSDSDLQKLLYLDHWVFKKNEPDSYPAVPFAYHSDPKNLWPKLDPYTGRVYNAKYNENISMRLSKKDLQKLWSDDGFKSFCREITIWHQEQYSSHTFPVRNHLRMPKNSII